MLSHLSGCGSSPLFSQWKHCSNGSAGTRRLLSPPHSSRHSQTLPERVRGTASPLTGTGTPVPISPAHRQRHGYQSSVFSHTFLSGNSPDPARNSPVREGSPRAVSVPAFSGHENHGPAVRPASFPSSPCCSGSSCGGACRKTALRSFHGLWKDARTGAASFPPCPAPLFLPHISASVLLLFCPVRHPSGVLPGAPSLPGLSACVPFRQRSFHVPFAGLHTLGTTRPASSGFLSGLPPVPSLFFGSGGLFLISACGSLLSGGHTVPLIQIWISVFWLLSACTAAY